MNIDSMDERSQGQLVERARRILLEYVPLLFRRVGSSQDEENLDFADAKFMLASCSALVNYLKSKSASVV